jgi:hypothetical protein
MAMMQYFASANAWSASDNWTWSCVEVYVDVAEALCDDLTKHPEFVSLDVQLQQGNTTVLVANLI